MNNWDLLKAIKYESEKLGANERKIRYSSGEYAFLVSSLLLELKDKIDTLEEQIMYQQKMAFGSLKDI